MRSMEHLRQQMLGVVVDTRHKLCSNYTRFFYRKIKMMINKRQSRKVANKPQQKNADNVANCKTIW